MLQQRFGVLGFLGIIILVVWAVGWVVFGFHDWPYHFLFPIGVVLLVIQGVRRVAA
jgi:hypothetical protein